MAEGNDMRRDRAALQVDKGYSTFQRKWSNLLFILNSANTTSYPSVTD
jgi:hypothetical protein